MSLIDDAPEGVNTPEFSVSELSGAVKRMIEGEFGHVRVRGEVGRVSRPRSGHVYLDLKDDRAVLAGVIWKGVAARLATPPEEGMEVVATGRLTTFPGQSKYQIVIEEIAPAGIGALMAMLEKRRKALAAEGLFDADRKRALPYLPRVIGVVTSPTGAVMRDILHRLRERFPVHVLVWPVAVQGEKCASEVASAITGFSALEGPLRPDVTIVARGGGSVEDLWGFNEEVVVRAAASSTIPLISAVGHETDTTLIDYAADRRAPTPSAAAEIAVPVRVELQAFVAELQARRLRAFSQGFGRRQQRLSDLARGLPRPEQLIAERRQRLDIALARLPRPAAMTRERRQIVESLGIRLTPALNGHIGQARLSLAEKAAGLAPSLRALTARARVRLMRLAFSPAALRQHLGRGRDRLSEAALRLAPATHRSQAQAAERLRALLRTLGAFSHKATLGRGYAVVRDRAGHLVMRADDVPSGARLTIDLAEGQIQAISDASGTGGHDNRRKRPTKNGSKEGDQGSLF